MMTRVKRMVVVDAWLRSSQTLLEYADNVGLDVGTCLGWIRDYGQPADSARWIPVRILDSCVDRYPLDEAFSGGGLRPDRHASHKFRQQWVPVVIQEHS
jgi:hypothetical protein